jgi:hypothetical protein
VTPISGAILVRHHLHILSSTITKLRSRGKITHYTVAAPINKFGRKGKTTGNMGEHARVLEAKHIHEAQSGDGRRPWSAAKRGEEGELGSEEATQVTP